MKTKKIFLGLLAVAFLLGITATGCDGSSDGEDNAYKGEWIGTFTPKDGEETGATLVFTDTEWTLTYDKQTEQNGRDVLIPDVLIPAELKGTYKKAIIAGVDLNMPTETSLGDVKIGSATILLQKLELFFTAAAGNHEGTGSFEKVKEETPPADLFVGIWKGDFKPKEGATEELATLEFTEIDWTFSLGENKLEGTYEKAGFGLLANLMMDLSSSSLGVTKVGTATVIPLSGELTLNITLGETKGSGTFTRQKE